MVSLNLTSEGGQKAVADDLQLLTIDDLSRITRYDVRHINNLIREGRIPKPLRIGSRPRWRQKEIVAWLDAGCPAEAKSPQEKS